MDRIGDAKRAQVRSHLPLIEVNRESIWVRTENGQADPIKLIVLKEHKAPFTLMYCGLPAPQMTSIFTSSSGFLKVFMAAAVPKVDMAGSCYCPPGMYGWRILLSPRWLWLVAATVPQAAMAGGCCLPPPPGSYGWRLLLSLGQVWLAATAGCPGGYCCLVLHNNNGYWSDQ